MRVGKICGYERECRRIKPSRRELLANSQKRQTEQHETAKSIFGKHCSRREETGSVRVVSELYPVFRCSACAIIVENHLTAFSYESSLCVESLIGLCAVHHRLFEILALHRRLAITGNLPCSNRCTLQHEPMPPKPSNPSFCPSGLSPLPDPQYALQRPCRV
jgi:hypothetical protein